MQFILRPVFHEKITMQRIAIRKAPSDEAYINSIVILSNALAPHREALNADLYNRPSPHGSLLFPLLARDVDLVLSTSIKSNSYNELDSAMKKLHTGRGQNKRVDPTLGVPQGEFSRKPLQNNRKRTTRKQAYVL